MPLICLRHGLDIYQESGKNHLDTPLSASGKANLVKLLEALFQRVGKPSAVYCSPFIRCRESAMICRQISGKNIDVYVEPDLAKFMYEVRRGVKIEESVTEETRRILPKNIESKSHSRKRILRVFEKIKQKHANDVVYVISHYFLFAEVQRDKKHRMIELGDYCYLVP